MTFTELCNQVLELDEKATKGPFESTAHAEQVYWINQGRMSCAGDLMRIFGAEAEKFSQACRVYSPTLSEEQHGILYKMHAFYSVYAPLLAKSCLRMKEFIEDSSDSNCSSCGCQENAQECLADVEKMLEGK